MNVRGRLEGKVAVITGTARGQGQAAAVRFRAEGATVVGGDLLTQADIPYLDVTDEQSVADWIAAAISDHGRIDILYNNAGAVRFGPIEQQSLEDWRLPWLPSSTPSSSPASTRGRTCVRAPARF
jgi:meso-butanediol dehydrogenase / (S,S)-butanediol dehydrogenase / diacetyl reductase